MSVLQMGSLQGNERSRDGRQQVCIAEACTLHTRRVPTCHRRADVNWGLFAFVVRGSQFLACSLALIHMLIARSPMGPLHENDQCGEPGTQV